MAYKKTNKLIEYNNDYNKTHYDRISLLVPQGKKEIIKQQAELNDESVYGDLQYSFTDLLRVFSDMEHFQEFHPFISLL